MYRDIKLKPVAELNSMDNMELYYGLEYLNDNGIVIFCRKLSKYLQLTFL